MSRPFPFSRSYCNIASVFTLVLQCSCIPPLLGGSPLCPSFVPKEEPASLEEEHGLQYPARHAAWLRASLSSGSFLTLGACGPCYSDGLLVSIALLRAGIGAPYRGPCPRPRSARCARHYIRARCLFNQRLFFSRLARIRWGSRARAIPQAYRANLSPMKHGRSCKVH